MTDTTASENLAFAQSPLHQVRDFVDSPPTGGQNPITVILRTMRGIWTYVIIAALLVAMLVGWGVFSVVSPVYESSGLVKLTAKAPKILYADRDDSRLRLYDAFVSAEATYLQSEPVVNRAFRSLKEKTTDLFPANFQHKDLADMITVKKLKGLIAVRARSTHRVQSTAAVNAILDAYIALHSEQNGFRQSLRARELEARLLELQAKQRRLGQQLLDIGEEYDASSLAKAHLTKVTQLEELDMRIAELTNSLIELETSNGALDADTGDMEIKRATLLDRAMADMVFERAKRAADLEQLMLRYQPTHGKVRSLTASMKVIDTAIESRRRLIATLGKTGAITGADGTDQAQSLSELKALKHKLSARRTELSDFAKILNGKLVQLKQINEEKSEISHMLSETRRILDQVIVESRNNMPGSVEILSRGNLPDGPADDKRRQFAAAGAVFAMGFLFVLVFLKRYLSSVLRYSDDLDIGLSPSQQRPMVFGPDADREDLSILMCDMQLSMLWPTKGPCIMSMLRVSPHNQFPLAQFADLASMQDLKTLLVRTSKVSKTSEIGFSNAIIAGEPITIDTSSHVHEISFGSASIASGFSRERAQQWLSEIIQDYDLILLDVGVAEQDYAARILPNLSDITLAVFSPSDNKRKMRRIGAQLANLITVFTDARPDDPGLRVDDIQKPSKKGSRYDKAA